MTAGCDAARVRRLLLWYPASWRARYGPEFAELLLDELGERPRCWRRTINVAATGLRARLAGAGLAGHPLDPARAARASLATLACSITAFGVVGAAMWSQLAIGLQWAVPGTRGITQSLALMSAAMLALVVLAVVAGTPLACAVVLAIARGAGRHLWRPLILTAASVLFLVVGGRHFENGWPGTGGHLLAHQGLVPGGLAAFGWAATMWVTSYWVHPAGLAAFGAARLAWMVASPAAIGCLLAGTAQLLRRVELSPRGFRYATWVGHVAWAVMAVFLAGSLTWLYSAAAATRPIFHPGVIDEAGLAALALAVSACVIAGHQAGLATRTASAGTSSAGAGSGGAGAGASDR
jgi:hypothetical protein